MKRKFIILNISKVVFMILLLMFCVFFTACSAIVSDSSLYIAAEQAVLAANTPKAEDMSTNLRKEKVVESWEDFEASRLPLIAAIPERDIYLYGVKPRGVVLYVKGTGHYFCWEYLTPRFVLPRMYEDDFDSDGDEELAVILYTGSGTGYAVEELHMVEIDEDEVLSREPYSQDYFKPNPEYFCDHYFRPESYLARLDEHVALKTYHVKDELMADIKIEGEVSTVSLKQLQSIKQDISVNDKPSFGNIVSFSLDGGKLVAQFVLGVTGDAFAAPYPIGEISAEVSYKGGTFVLTDLHFELDEDLLPE